MRLWPRDMRGLPRSEEGLDTAPTPSEGAGWHPRSSPESGEHGHGACMAQ